MKSNIIIVFFMLGLISESFAETIDILAWNRIKIGHPEMYSILEVALENTKAEYGEYRLIQTERMEQGRVVRALEENELVHVAVFAPTKEREAKLLPIRIPVTKGLLGFRVCLVKSSNLGKFKGVTSLEDWKNNHITIGQGTHWPDTKILEINGLPVIKSVQYKPLFNMLARERFDCFSRSVNEILPEYQSHKHLGLEIEPNLLLTYKLPTFFFVSKKNPILAERIEKGLLTALENGSFDNMFEKNYAETIKKLDLKNRISIPLDNPFLTPPTRETLQDDKLWYRP